MKQLLKRLLHRAGLVVATRNHIGARFVLHPPTSLFDVILLRQFSSLEGINFIQVGANDGRRLDPIHAYIERYGWSGVLAEPMPFIFRKLQQTYGRNPRLQLLSAAVDLSAGQREIHCFTPAALAKLPEWVWGLASFNRGQLLKTAHSLGLDESHLMTETVPTITWSELWNRTPRGTCDVLVLDTEGYDITLLRAASLAEHRPALIHFEHMHTPRTERIAFYGELLELGYLIATDINDTTAWRPTQPLSNPSAACAPVHSL